jgi:hypothetical protein
MRHSKSFFRLCQTLAGRIMLESCERRLTRNVAMHSRLCSSSWLPRQRWRRWHASASLFYDINSKKKDIDWTTGNPFTLMWGLGGNYEFGKLFKGWAGVAGYSQWQVTSTQGASVPLFVSANKTQINAVGPEFTTLQGALTIRYFWQFGGKFSTQGRGLYAMFVLPI